jgi:hypothetical protein
MRRSRRGGRGGGGMEFGGSGEDSFVAVVVTKLTGALLFILLLTMVIMALIPKAADTLPRPGAGADEGPKLAIVTPAQLPEAIAGRPYAVALSATGGKGPLSWSVMGDLPEGISVDNKTGILGGTPLKGMTKPSPLTIAVGDGQSRATATTTLVVYKPDAPLGFASRFKPALPPVPWRSWAENGFGFLIVALVGVVGLQTLSDLERRLGAPSRRRFLAYRLCVGGATVLATVVLAVWLWKPPFPI